MCASNRRKVCRGAPAGAPRRFIRIADWLWVLGLISFAGCSRQEPVAVVQAGSSQSTLRVSQRNEPADLDPATATLPDEFFIIRALSEGLLAPDPKGGPPQPAAAEKFTVSADGLTYTFTLRAGAKWSNGEPVTAQDFLDSYRRLLTPATAAPKADLFFAVKNAREFATGTVTDFSAVGFRALGPDTLSITLTRPAPRFPHYVASGPWIPVNPRAVAKFGRQWTQPAHHVGNGPFLLGEWRAQQRIIVQKNTRYHAADRVKLGKIEFLRFDSADSEERAFRVGQVDVTMGIPQSKIATYAAERPAALQRTPLAETRFLSFNTTRGPLRDVRVRRALALALDRSRIADRVVLGGQEPAKRFLAPPLQGGVSPDAASLQDHAPAEAQRLLSEAGFPGGKGFPPLELSAWSSSQVPVIEAIQEMWRQKLGIPVTLQVREAKVHLAALGTGDYDLAFVTTLIDVADAMTLLDDFATGAANNFPHWQSPAFDRLLIDARQQGHESQQNALLGQAEAQLLTEAPVAPVYFNVKNWLKSERVRGWQEDAIWTRFYLNVEIAEK